ncbi:MAG: hypothetical protein M3P06_11230 [Acidobacteriota bacterium]|nr:hypothetical protein [Acidobacteriota bacterium]
MTPLRRLVLRCIRVFWVQQRAIDRALLAAMHTLRRQSRDETARMREELTELAAGLGALRERNAAETTASAPGARQEVVSDDETALWRETDR